MVAEGARGVGAPAKRAEQPTCSCPSAAVDGALNQLDHRTACTLCRGAVLVGVRLGAHLTSTETKVGMGFDVRDQRVMILSLPSFLGVFSQSRLWPAPTHEAHMLRTYEDSKEEEDMLFARHMVHEHLI